MKTIKQTQIFGFQKVRYYQNNLLVGQMLIVKQSLRFLEYSTSTLMRRSAKHTNIPILNIMKDV